jgi:hypothetical protein
MALSKIAQPHYTREEFAEILQECGFRAQFYTEPGLFPQIKSGIGGHTFFAYVSGKSVEENHDNIMREALLELITLEDTTLSLINEWNCNYNIQGKRNFTVASAKFVHEDEVGMLSATTTILLEHTSPANIALQIDRWAKDVSKMIKNCAVD